MHELSKGTRKAIRELAGVAYERELSAELAKLEGTFADWRNGTIDAFEVSRAIHVFHDGVSRQLFNRYSGGAAVDQAVAFAILRGTVLETEILESARKHLARLVSVFREVYADE